MNYFTWHTADIAVALESFGTTTVRSVVRVNADGILSTRVVNVAGPLACISDASLGQWAVVVVCARN